MKRLFSVSAISAVLLAIMPLTPASAARKPVTATAASANQSASAQAQQQLTVLGQDYYEAQARFDPLGATLSGDNRFDDQLGMSIAPKQRAQQFDLYRKFVGRLHAINADKLSRLDRSNYDVLDYLLSSALKLEPFPEHLLPIDQMGGFPAVQLAIFANGHGSQPISTVKQYRAYLRRLAQLPGWIDQSIANMREGMKMGVVQSAAVMQSALPQFQHLMAATPEASIFYTPIKNMPVTFSNANKRSLSADYRNTIVRELAPALIKLNRFLENDYLPAARHSTGWSALPNGRNWYLALVANLTTTSLTPDEIHTIGIAEVARIQGQFGILGPQLGYMGPANRLPGWSASQDKFRPFNNEQEILDAFRKLNATVQTKLPTLFNVLSKASLTVQLEPELTRATASSHYTPAAMDGSRPGIFWAVVDDPKQYMNTGMTTLFLHEGQPGHHFQGALQQELNLPQFRKLSWFTAYGEGWALYAETLGKEMGLYQQPDAYFGHLKDELLRAVRLVVDTGMHAQGWSRERAIQYMRDTLGYTEATAKNAVERYMALPAQALGYKIGELKIMELRQRASDALGPKFSLPAFHAVILDGALPLTLLEAKVDRWIAETK
jgi:uncharacterized protein (DUF885 family)